MKEEKDDLEKAVESLRKALREQEQNAGMQFLYFHVLTSYLTIL